jgi:hypothetical protein
MPSKKETLPQPPDKIILNLLKRAHSMFSHALLHASSASEIDRMVAIHGLDNSIEYLLRIIVDHLDIEAKAGKNLESVELAQLAGDVNRYLKDTFEVSLPYFKDIKRLRQIRNLVQHGVVDPQPELQRLTKVTERFLNKVIKMIFGLNLSEIKVSSIINNKIIREHLKKAEQYLEKGKFLDSIVASRDAFENAYFLKIKDLEITTLSLPSIMELKKVGDWTSLSLIKIIEELELFRLGISPINSQRFIRYINHLPSELGGHIIMQRPWEKQDAQFCYEFASNLILDWQFKEQTPIYELNSVYDNKTRISNIDLSKGEHGCSYAEIDGVEYDVWYLPKNLKEKIEKI